MKLLFLYAALSAFSTSYAQIVVSGKVPANQSGKALVFNVPFDCWNHTINSREVVPDNEGEFSIQLPVEKPQIIFLTYAGQRLQLYTEPGKTLVMKIGDSTKAIRFEGSLGRENQFRQKLGLTTYHLGKQIWNDTLSQPEEIMTDLKARSKLH